MQYILYNTYATESIKGSLQSEDNAVLTYTQYRLKLL